MDKNIAALLREDAVTVRVQFQQTVAEQKQGFTQQSYQYVTNLKLQEGDKVVVDGGGKMKLAEVVEVHETVEIKPNEDIQYKWILLKVDLSEALANAQRNKQIEDTVSDAYRANLRRSFAQQILSGVDDSQRDALTLLLKGA
jgi:preprotein translocase subunit YajC